MPKEPAPHGKRRPSPYERTKECEPAGNECRAFLVKKAYCSFCGGRGGERRHECIECGAVVCEQDSPDGMGCIAFATVSELVPFLCLLCDQREWKRAARSRANPPYGFRAYGERKHARLNWPLVLISMQLAGSPDSFLRDALTMDLKHLENENVVHASLRGSGEFAAQGKMQGALKFIEGTTAAGFPANTFVVLDTHAETETGSLQYGGGKTNPTFAPASDVVRDYCGEALLKAMHAASFSAEAQGPPENPKWFNNSAYFRGGWRGLLLPTCGPAVRAANGLMDMQRLVENGAFDLVLAFGGGATLPANVRSLLTGVIERLGVNKYADIWGTVIQVVSQELDLLQGNSVVVVFKERTSGAVECREIGLHLLPMRPWGVEFAACGKDGCRPKAYEFCTRTSGGGVRMKCRRCGWASEVVKYSDVKEHVFPFNSTLPNVYWHTYPTCASLAAVFVTVTKQKGKK